MVMAKGNWDYSGEPKLRILSLGAGVQSSTMALMANEGAFGPLPDYAIFADTGWEPKKVYEHLDWLKSKFKNVEGHLINLDLLFESFKDRLSKFDNEHGLANSKARLRMATLYQVAASNNGIVVGTGNKVEDFGVGFYTKYGDGGVDISPIADCTKTDVWKLSKNKCGNLEQNLCYRNFVIRKI